MIEELEELEERVRRVEDDVEERVDELKESIAVETKVSKYWRKEETDRT